MKREEMIERLVEEINGWDFGTLIDYAKDQMTESLRYMPDDDLQDHYNAHFGDCPDDWIDDEESCCLPEVVKCACGRETDKGEKCWWCGAQN